MCEDILEQPSKKSNDLFSKPIPPKITVQMVHPSFSVQHETHEPITIIGDDNFKNIAFMENWPGDGTPSDPFIIEGYNITGSYGDLIVIHDTTVYFIIRNNYLNGLSEAWGGLVFYNVNNGIVINNNVKNVDTLGIGVYFSKNINISDNIVQNTNLNGIRIEACPGPSLVTNNIITNSTDAALWVGDSSNKTTIEFNTIYENTYGIVFTCDVAQYSTSFSSFITNNHIYNNFYGIELSYSNNILISYNSFEENFNYGVFLSFTCENTRVKYNNFFENHVEGRSQAKDDGKNNTYKFNFWNEWTEPDGNDDGIVDNPYEIDGIAYNLDDFPLTTLTNISSKSPNPVNIIFGSFFLLIIIGSLVILLIKNRK
ncbi:MAG: right-handed parallel beta-helix repeat-containing protein [Candidatus Hodarchaeota archaeon]